MTLKEQLMEDMKNAMRAHETLKLDVVRMIRSDVKNFEIDNGEADDEKVQKIIKSMLKQQKDALVDFLRAARQDLIDETNSKIEIFASYLPTELSDAELEAVVAEVLASVENKDFGPLMGQVMKKVGSRADGGRVTAFLKKALS
ncbi:MAG: GatB/Yqey domain-containing protein [Candidatus Pacebacteria bacterium GW2011_GWF2_38_9]|nr:MAG: hypothetical protein US01_C0001G0190 [candidate division TM6 bacterium GW2011_GWF2_28_16]KKQ09871.1 MAG: GatB/Yqey domain-containing protein [Candidatus Pacebacteria bacterium GW2011_GWF1_36_5]KKQ88541.1 MAG: GatB/Yqey domain-containing protein [Candidatus Pacebacteria bacterium GW2011_GWF2_38_9]HAZ73325.1 aspartyl-tRNA amidotransferase [Candidatus Paceibacterota bacterium]